MTSEANHSILSMNSPDSFHAKRREMWFTPRSLYDPMRSIAFCGVSAGSSGKYFWNMCLAAELGKRLGPQDLHCLDVFIRDLPPLLEGEGDVDGCLIDLRNTKAEAEDGAAFRNLVEGGPQLRREHGVAQWHDRHGGDEAQSLRPGGEIRREHEEVIVDRARAVGRRVAGRHDVLTP